MVKNLPKPRKSSDANQQRISFRAQCEAPEEAEEEVGEDGFTDSQREANIRYEASRMNDEDFDDDTDWPEIDPDEDEDEEE